MNWREAVIAPELELLEAMRRIDATSLQVAVVVSKNGRLLGLLTDGDIRRAILEGHPLDIPVRRVMTTEPFQVGPDVNRRQALRMMQEHRVKIRHLPIVGDDGVLLGIHFADDVMYASVVDNWVVLMAGGKGTRLRPLTLETPKPMLHVGGQAILETIIRRFIRYGFHNFYISVNYLAEQIMSHFGDGSAFNATIRYLHEEQPLGTAGALSAIPTPPETPILVTNGDVLTKTDYRDFLDCHMRADAMVTMGVRQHEIQVPYGVANVEGDQITSIEEKPTQMFNVNAGLYALSPAAWHMIPKEHYYDMPSLIEEALAAGGKAAAYPMRDYWIDIGQPADFVRANSEFDVFFR